MNAKEFWSWIFSHLEVNDLYSIIKETEIVFKGFRLNSATDLGGNNKKLFQSTLLQRQNISKIKLYIVKEKPFSFNKSDTYKDKEINELYTMCLTSSNLLEVLLSLIQENDEKKAIQVYAYVKQENFNLLKEKGLQNKSAMQEVRNNSSIEKNEKKKDDVKLSKLEGKISNLKEEIEKRDKNHKEAIQIKDEQYSKLLNRYNEKNKLYTELLKISRIAEEEFKKEKKKWEQDETNLHKQIKQKDLQILKLVEELQINSLTKQSKVKLSKKKILLVGNPMNNRLCRDENFDFDILEDGIDMEYYHFKEGYDAYWVLSYILNNKSRTLLQKNMSFNKLDSKKVMYFYDFLTLKNKVEALKRDEVRV
ncbi:hypothetical protein P9Z84_26195 [Bacillus cereus]|nr:hypothetical protein [Bacillus cereus]